MIDTTTAGIAVSEYLLEDDGTYPNSDLPLLVYREAFVPGASAEKMIGRFASHNWRNSWKNGIYNFHHYHSTTHEVLGIYRGTVSVLFGGEQGVELSLRAGDVVIIPAGTAHKNIAASADFGCVGAYPGGRNFDINYGRRGERPATDDNILRVPLPIFDPVFGKQGAMLEHWAYLV